MASRRVFIAGQGMVPVTRKSPVATIANMGRTAVENALTDAQIGKDRIQGLYAGNMVGGMLCKQQHVGVLVATEVGLRGIDVMTIESCCGAGGAALRTGYLAIKSGAVDTVVVTGVERMTHVPLHQTTQALATASHWANEGGKGETFVTLNGLLKKMYIEKYSHLTPKDLSIYPINAHKNAVAAEHAVLRKAISLQNWEHSRVVWGDIRVMDASPVCDGAAAVVLTTDEGLLRSDRKKIEILGSGSASDILTVQQRPNPLHLEAAARSFTQALSQANLPPSSLDFFELHDAYSIMACLSLESTGLIEPGHPSIPLPISTFGGLKARGHPVGATGVYQAAESFLQLQGLAGDNQVFKKDGKTLPEVGMSQNIGGAGSSVFAHVYAVV
eukprot:TRINITY_DN23603_c0_g1_i1.p1 TRINITY_DN23603_c0_g1~~TRINITY_DN23603_c0_g1_i1.p1  ORF type:complete len:386 (+),score=30.31 TRINITY_DN23603_c0_g1_i1:73-1230(+)